MTERCVKISQFLVTLFKIVAVILNREKSLLRSKESINSKNQKEVLKEYAKVSFS